MKTNRHLIRFKWLIALLSLMPGAMQAQHVYHVMPSSAANGKLSTGNGSEAFPWDLQTALSGAGGVIKPGDVILVHEDKVNGNVYWGYDNSTTTPHAYKTYNSTLAGTSTNPIIVKAAPCEHPVIDCTPIMGYDNYYAACSTHIGTPEAMLFISGAYTWFQGLEVRGSETDREDATGNALKGGIGVYVNSAGSGNKIINCIIHDMIGAGIGSYPANANTEVNGNLLYNNGWYNTSSSPHETGQGVYAQNVDNCAAPSTALYRHNILFGNANDNFHINGSGDVDKANGFVLDGNIAFNPSLFTDVTSHNYRQYGHMSQFNNKLINNHFCMFSDETYGYNVSIGLNTNLVLNHIITDNRFITAPNARSVLFGFEGSGFSITNALGLIFARNFTYGYNLGVTISSSNKWNNPLYPMGTIYSDSNTYVMDTTYAGTKFTFQAGSNYCGTSGAISKWNLDGSVTGWYGSERKNWRGLIHSDLHSAEVMGITSSGVTQMEIFKTHNDYNPGRANIVVYNWACSTSTSLNLSGYVASGAPYRIVDAQNYGGSAIASGTYSGPITLPLNNTTRVQPVGVSNPANTHMSTRPHTNSTTYRSRSNMFNTLVLETVPYSLNLAYSGSFCLPTMGGLIRITYNDVNGTSTTAPKSWVASRAWALNGTPIAGADKDTLYPADTGVYTFTLTYENCLTLTKTIHVTDCSNPTMPMNMGYQGSNDRNNTPALTTDEKTMKMVANGAGAGRNTLAVNPNPTADHATVKYSIASPGKVTIDLLDMSGRLVSRLLEKTQEKGAYSLELGNDRLPQPGQYKVRMVVNEDVITQTLIRQ